MILASTAKALAWYSIIPLIRLLYFVRIYIPFRSANWVIAAVINFFLFYFVTQSPQYRLGQQAISHIVGSVLMLGLC